MSIATLKKKTGVKYNNMSVSKPLFSLNGTYRNQGFVGQTTLSRSLPRTLIKNGGYKNYGGCCGTFPVGEMVKSSFIDTEDNTVVKLSTKTTSGLLHVDKYQWIWRPYPCTRVKIDDNHGVNTQSDYIKAVEKKAVSELCPIIDVPCKVNCPLTRPRYTPFKQANTFALPSSKLAAISQGEYLLKLDKDCSAIDKIKLAERINNCNKCALVGNR